MSFIRFGRISCFPEFSKKMSDCEYTYGTHIGRPDTKKVRFYDEMASEWDLESLVKS